MDRMQAPPRGAISGLLADAMFSGLNYMKNPRRTQQMQLLGQMLESTGVPAVVDRVSYGEPLTTGAGMTTQMRPETESALMTMLGLAPAGRPIIKATKGLPVGMSIKDVSAPQEAALRLAQQRAALPVEKGGLGLPKDNTALDRAEAMGFQDAYHGTTQGRDLKNFETTRTPWFTDNPKVANTYATGRPEFGRPEGKAVLPVSLRFDDPMVVADARGNSWKSVPAIMPNEGGEELFYTTDKLAKFARGQGKDALVVNNVFDPGSGRMPTSAKGEKALTGTTYAMFNPDNIRSRFAAFDPFRKTAATAALYGVAAPDLLAAEQEPVPEQNESMIQSLLKMLGR
jgi:hypothetical protein